MSAPPPPLSGPYFQPPPPPPTFNYLRPYDFQSFFKAVWYLYRDNVATVLGLSLAPLAVIFPLAFVIMIVFIAAGLSVEHARELIAPIIAVAVVIMVIVIGAVAVISSYFQFALIKAAADAIIGGKPGFVDSLKSVGLGAAVNAFLATLLLGLIGLALLAPFAAIAAAAGFAASWEFNYLWIAFAALMLLAGLAVVLCLPAFFMFTVPAVICEGVGPVEGLKRSIELGRGFYLRNLGYWYLPVLANFLISMMGPISALAILLMPVFSIVPTLLYFEMRVRKEGLGTRG